MNIENNCNYINVPGVSALWYAPMSAITLPFSVENSILIPQNIISSQPLHSIKPLHNSLQFGSVLESSANGSAYTQIVKGRFSNAEKAVVANLSSLTNKRLFVIFKDHTNQYRFITNALISLETDTSTILGEAATAFSFSSKSKQQHYFYTGAATVSASGTLSFT